MAAMCLPLGQGLAQLTGTVALKRLYPLIKVNWIKRGGDTETCYLPLATGGERRPQCGQDYPLSPHPLLRNQCLHFTDRKISAKLHSMCGPESRIQEHDSGRLNRTRVSVWGDPGFTSQLYWMPGIFGGQNLPFNVKQEVTHLLVGLC